MTSNEPPTVSPASRARSTAARIAAATVSSTHRTSSSASSARAASKVTASGSASFAPPISTTWLTTSTPNRVKMARATAPAATRAAVSRALARSRTSRRSSRPYFSPPARSACPGRGRVTAARRAPGSDSSGSASTLIVWRQFSQSLLRIWSAIGLPSVRPRRTPDRISARSRSMAIRRPRPYPS